MPFSLHFRVWDQLLCLHCSALWSIIYSVKIPMYEIELEISSDIILFHGFFPFLVLLPPPPILLINHLHTNPWLRLWVKENITYNIKFLSLFITPDRYFQLTAGQLCLSGPQANFTCLRLIFHLISLQIYSFPRIFYPTELHHHLFFFFWAPFRAQTNMLGFFFSSFLLLPFLF